MKTLDVFIKENGIQARAYPIPIPAHMQDWAAHAWRVRLARPEGQELRHMQVEFGGGSAVGKPTAADVLNCVASDSSGWENASGWVDWAKDYGMEYEPDDESQAEVRKLYNKVNAQRVDLIAFLETGDDRNLYEELLYQVEGL